MATVVEKAVLLIYCDMHCGTGKLTITFRDDTGCSIPHAYIEEFKLRKATKNTIDLAERERLGMTINKE
jgi:hypothetical protein